MARHESDREDLIREATALKRRIECRLPGDGETLVGGFRSNGWLSIYFSSDPVFHLDAGGRLRRAFVGGILYRTQGNTLARLTRVRGESVTELQRDDLNPIELSEFLTAMRTRLMRFIEAFDGRNVEVIRRVPDDDEILPDLVAAIQQILCTEEPLAPPIKAKR